MVWLLGVGLGGEPDPAALDTAGPATTVPPATSAMTTSATVETSTATETTLAPALVPDPPSGLTATPVDPTTVQLTWTDLSTNETAFEIDDGQVTRTAPADAQELVWDGLAPGLQACFRVRAVGNAGASSWEPATDYVCVQTPQPDLIAQPIELVGGDAVCIGTSPVFQASGVNAGSAPSDDFVVRWLPDGGQPVDEPTSGLPPQGAEKYPFTWVRVQPGTHELVFALDADGRIVEADETNNQSVLTFEAVQCPG
jgi:hypothetical protein